MSHHTPANDHFSPLPEVLEPITATEREQLRHDALVNAGLEEQLNNLDKFARLFFGYK